MAKQTIKYTIKQDGTVEEQVEGVYGDVCENLTKDLERKLGDLESRVHTSDYYQSLENKENVPLQHHQNSD
tara:strand:- start:1371 stop:1583 length:213 start_codon:yes stop_codon:yes gene_type:complete